MTPTDLDTSDDPVKSLPSLTPINTALTLEQWAKDEGRRVRLREILSDPVFQQAVSTLRASMTPEVPACVSGDFLSGGLPNAQDLTGLLALRHAHRSGALGVLNFLENLTKTPKEKRSPALKTFRADT